MNAPLTEVELSRSSPPWWRKAAGRAGRAGVALWKFFAGVILTQSLLGAVAVAGWTFRVAQRTVQRSWWKQGAAGAGEGFRAFVQGSTYHRDLGGWPNWIVQPEEAWRRARQAPGWGKFAALRKAGLGSLWRNLKWGGQGIFNTLVFTLPGCVLMLFSWYAGWHNSFNKGYEQAVVGPLLGVSGILLFIAAMYYVPMAQMRQASTGNWRSFYEFSTVWRLVRKRWLECLLLAVLYTLCSVPVTILKTAPAFFPQINPQLAELAPAEALSFLRRYFFWAACLFFPAYVILRMAAARVYASSLLACVQSGALPEDALAENEWETLHRLDLLTVRPAAPRHFLVRTIAWLGTRVGRATTGVALLLVWFTFVAQVYVSEFLIRSPGAQGWLNHPLVQVPWFRYIPSPLAEAAKTEEAAKTAGVGEAVGAAGEGGGDIKKLGL